MWLTICDHLLAGHIFIVIQMSAFTICGRLLVSHVFVIIKMSAFRISDHFRGLNEC